MNSYLQYNLHGLLNLAAALFDISVGLIVLFQNPQSRLNKSFFMITLNTAVWMGCFGMESLVRNIGDATLWQSLSYFLGVPFIPASFYSFSSRVAHRQDTRGIERFILGWSFLAMIPMTFFTTTVVGLTKYGWGVFPYFQKTPLGLAYAVFLLVPFAWFSVLTFLNLYWCWKHALSPRDRAQTKNILIAFLIAHTGTFDFLLAFQVPIYPFGYLSLTLLIGIVAYNIVRHQFMDINVVLRKFSMIFLIYSFLLAFSVPLALFIVNQNFGSLHPSQLSAVVEIGLLIGVVISAGPFIYAAIVRHAFWLKGHSSTALTHELKSPLATIQSATQVLLDDQNQPVPDKSKTYDYLHMIQRNTERLELFVQDLLSVAQIQNEAVSLQKSMFDLNKTLQDVVETYSLLAEKKGIAFELQLEKLPLIEADSIKIQQAFSNLISNALKFSTGGLVVVRTRHKDGVIFCHVTDTGPGIPKADLERVFDRFFHGKHSSKGSGLGLTIAKAWVEAHGGKIWAESEGEGKGATVTFTLPI